MHPSRQHPALAWLLLAVFAVGGVLGPTAHRVQHAGGHGDVPADGRCHIEAAHRADEPVVSSDASAERVLDCTACSARLIVAPPPQAAELLRSSSISSLSTTAPHRVLQTASASNLIRGPPHAA